MQSPDNLKRGLEYSGCTMDQWSETSPNVSNVRTTKRSLVASVRYRNAFTNTSLDKASHPLATWKFRIWKQPRSKTFSLGRHYSFGKNHNTQTFSITEI